MVTFRDYIRKLLQRPALILGLMVAIAIVIRMLLISVRWINPDEGPHMMGARFLLEGRIPIAEYGSRQPLYLLVIAAFFKLFGVSLHVGRIMAVLANTATGLMLYFLGRKLFDVKTGLVAAGTFLFLPLMIFWAPVVKTEPLAALLACLCIFFMADMLKNQDTQPGKMFVAGLFGAAAFYVRQPTVSLPMVMILASLVLVNQSWLHRIKQISWFLGGFLTPVLLIWAFYLNYMSLNELFFSQLNPLNLILNRALDLLGLLPESMHVVDSEGYRILDQEVAQTLANLTQTALFILPLVLGTLAALFVRPQKSSANPDLANATQTLGLLYLWALVGIVLYGYQAITRGFFSQYGTEIYLPMILLTSFAVVKAAQKIASTNLAGFFLSSGGILIFIYLAQKKMWQFYPGPMAYLILAGLLAGLCLVLISANGQRARIALIWFLASIPAALGYYLLSFLRINEALTMILALVIFALGALMLWSAFRVSTATAGRESVLVPTIFIAGVLSVAISGTKIGPSYDCIWSLSALEKMDVVLGRENSPAGQVLSGAMIWQLESHTPSFQDVAHPTEFLKKRWQNFEILFAENPPALIVLDGYTERKFQKYWRFLSAKIASDYNPIANITGSKYPIVIYKHKPTPELSVPAAAKENR